jgi:adenosylmethionine-8-amino-7-oxononanoate aminotransferase
LGVLGALEYDFSKGGGTVSKEEEAAFFDRIAVITKKRGLAIRGNGICLPMIITRQQIDEAIGILRECIREALPS